MVRRRRDQGHAGIAVAQPGDGVVDLAPGQLPALARLGALGDLDLQHLGIDQVLRGHPEAARGDLLDLRRAVGAVAALVLAALAGIGARAQPVHGQRQGLVRLRRQRAERHAGGIEARRDVFDRLHLRERHRRAPFAQAQQVAQHHRRARVDQFAEGLVVGALAAARGPLQGLHHVGVEGVVLGVVHVLEQAARPRRRGAPGVFGQGARVGRQFREAGALDPAGGASEAQLDHLPRQADDLEQLRAAVAGDRRDAHLGEDLQQPLVQAAAVAALDRREALRVEFAAALQLGQRLQRQIGMHGGRAVADQHRHVVRVAGGAGVDQQVGAAAQPGADQRVVHRAGGEQGMHRHPPRRRVAVGQHQQHAAVGDRPHRLGGELAHHLAQIARAVPMQAEPVRPVDALAEGQQALEFPVRQHRRFDHHPLGVAARLLEQVELRAQAGLQRHHDLLAQRIDGRVGDLRELLAEVVVQRARLARQHRQRRVVAHRGDRLLPLLGQHPQHLLALLVADAEQLLAAAPPRRRPRLPVRHPAVDQGADVARALPQPLPVGPAGAVAAVDVARVQELAGAGVDRHHLARPHAALGHHLGVVVLVHADLRSQHDAPVAGDHVAGRAQAVAVQHAGGVAAVGQHDASRPVPGLHVHRAVLVEGAQVRIHAHGVLPGGRDQQAHGAEDVDAAGVQDLQHVVERAGVRALHRDQRPQLLQPGQVGAAESARPRLGPVAVAADGVDLAVVRQVAERLRQRPLRQGVGGEALVEDADRGREARVVEVGVEPRQVGRHHQPLVGDDVRRQAAYVEFRVARQVALDAAPRQQQQRGAAVGVAAGQIDVQLLDAWQRGARLRTQHFGVGRHRAPAERAEAELVDAQLERRARASRALLVAVQEHHRQREIAAALETRRGRRGAEELLRHLQQQAAAVAGAPVGIDRAAVRQPFQRADRGLHQAVAGLPVHLRDQAEAAAVALEFGAVEAGGGGRLHGHGGVIRNPTWQYSTAAP